MGIRIEDIANMAGVSIATISRVINRPELVSPATRVKVEAVIQQAGYNPNYFARGLKKHSADSVGIITSLHTNPYFIEIIDAIESVLSANGTYTYICCCESRVELEEKYAQELVRRNIDALFVIETPSLNTAANYFYKAKFECPVILINQYIKPYGERNYVVRCDQKCGIQEVFAQALRKRLFPFMLFLCAEKNYSYTYKARLFRNWCRTNHISPKNGRILISNDIIDANSEKAVWDTYEAALKILASPVRPRAILAGNEYMAMGIMAAARKLSISIPGELAVIGVDNTMLSRLSFPALSVVDLRMKEVGTAAAALYLDIKRNPDKKRARINTIPSVFCSRDSL
jgi:LacI family transcriptional regulator/LacI family asc operon transcriptional repressor